MSTVLPALLPVRQQYGFAVAVETFPRCGTGQVDGSVDDVLAARAG